MGSKPKNQHYVPRVYLKPWRNRNRKIWIADKNQEDEVVERKEEKILSARNLYTVDFDQEFVINNCEEVKKEFIYKINSLMDSRNVYAKYRDRKIKDFDQIKSDLKNVEQWHFFKEDFDSEVNRSKIIEDIKKLTSFYLEEKFSDYFENQWSQKRDKFIKFCESQYDEIINGKLVKRSQVDSVIKFAVSMCIRSDESTLKEIARTKALESLRIPELAEKLSMKEVVDDFTNQYWLKELYKMVTDEEGFYYYFCELFSNYNFQMILFKVGESGSFMTSDNPFFIVERSQDKRGMYFPIDPKYLIFITGNNEDVPTTSEKIFLRMEIINSEKVEEINMIVKSNANKYIVYSGI